MKKILLAIGFIILSLTLQAQTQLKKGLIVGNGGNVVTIDSIIKSSTFFKLYNSGTELINIDTATMLNKYARKASPTFTGTVTLPSGTSIGNVSSTEIGYVNNVTSAIQTQLDARKYESYDYFIEEVAGTVYARPSPNVSYTAQSGALLSTVLNACFGQLTSGGRIYIKEGTYDDNENIVVTKSNITIQGAGRYKTIIKLKDHFDDGRPNTGVGLIHAEGVDRLKLISLELDGNQVNQDSITTTADMSPFKTAFVNGVYTEDTRWVTVEDCYIHDFTEAGVITAGCDFFTVNNCHIKNTLWNGITFGWGSDFGTITNNIIEGDTTITPTDTIGGIGDVGIALYGRNHTVSNNTIRRIYGVHGYDNSSVSISFEAAGPPYDGSTARRSQYHLISNNTLKGRGQKAGIVSNALNEGSLGVSIIGNYIDSCGVAISMMGDSSLISKNKIVNPQGQSYNYGIFVQDGDYNFITGNDITCRTIGSGDYPILLTNSVDGADYNKVTNNNLFGGTYYSIGIGHANCDGNIIMGNIFNDVSGGDYDIYDIGTGTIKNINYDFNTARWTPLPSLNVGIPGSFNDVKIDSLRLVSSQIAAYVGADTTDYYVTYAQRENGVALADSSTYAGGYFSYNDAHQTLTPRTNDGAALGTTDLKYSDLFLASGSVINFDNGDVTGTHAANKLTIAGGELDVIYYKSGGNAFYAENGSEGAESTAIKGAAGFSGTAAVASYGVQGVATGTNANATHIGIYGYATGGGTNYAGKFLGNVNIAGSLILIAKSDTVSGTQTKSVSGLYYLKTDGACTLNGLSGGIAGQVLTIINANANALVLKHNGTGTQKFYIAGAGDLTLTNQGYAVTCFYDGSYWYVTGKGF